MFLHHQLHENDTKLVQRVLANSTNSNSIAALDRALNGGLQEEWRYFALFNMNNDLVPLYVDHDGYRGQHPATIKWIRA
jgi:hypothetical protein